MERHLQHPTNMYCQKCRTPLKLDGSLEALNPAAFDLLVGKAPAEFPMEESYTFANFSIDK